MKITNISGVQRHLESQHPAKYKEFFKKKEAVLKKKKEKTKAKASAPNDKKQPKLSFTPVVDPELQKRWDEALVEYIGDTQLLQWFHR